MPTKFVNQEIDLAGKYRVWMEVTKDELTMFKFNKQPTQEMADNALINFIDTQEGPQQTELDSIIGEIHTLIERKEILESEINVASYER